MSRAEAKKIVSEAVPIVLKEKRHLVDVIREKTEAPLDWAALRDETAYFGASDIFITRVLAEFEKVRGEGIIKAKRSMDDGREE
jgi:3-carboxy-cis,cis-muconate cycloisomerase